MSEHFKIGDVVQLKSGSPTMTVVNVHEYGGTSQVHCSWFDGSKPNVDVFPLEALERYTRKIA